VNLSIYRMYLHKSSFFIAKSEMCLKNSLFVLFTAVTLLVAIVHIKFQFSIVAKNLMLYSLAEFSVFSSDLKFNELRPAILHMHDEPATKTFMMLTREVSKRY